MLPVPARRGKVRDIYDLGDELLLVASDRISAFDVVLPTPIPGKGAVLTELSEFWFRYFSDSVPHHLIEVVHNTVPPGWETYLPLLRGRTMRCRKAQVVPIEFVVRGYLAGSGWAEYCENGRVCGIPLPKGLVRCAKLSSPIFTPATKAQVGHDENIDFETACRMVDEPTMRLLRNRSMEIYSRASEYAMSRGVILADAKFEWGRIGNELVLIDEILTPDSSRFWPAETYKPGIDQASFDKQFVRNYLLELIDKKEWNKSPPGPALPPQVVVGVQERYHEALRRIVG